MSGKKRNVMLFVLLFTLFLGVIVPVQAQSYGGTKTIRVAYRENADFINESWENQLADLKSGKVDLICNAQKTDAREDSVF